MPAPYKATYIVVILVNPANWISDKVVSWLLLRFLFVVNGRNESWTGHIFLSTGYLNV